MAVLPKPSSAGTTARTLGSKLAFRYTRKPLGIPTFVNLEGSSFLLSAMSVGQHVISVYLVVYTSMILLIINSCDDWIDFT